MQLKFFAFFREVTREAQREWQQPAANIEALLHQLSQHYGPAFERKVFAPDGTLSPNVIILVNGRHIQHLEDIHTSLKHDDAVAIFPVVAGGSLTI